jgi:hypothetical protein
VGLVGLVAIKWVVIKVTLSKRTLTAIMVQEDRAAFGLITLLRVFFHRTHLYLKQLVVQKQDQKI